MSFGEKKTWIDLEQALMQDLGLEDEEDISDIESSRNSDDDDHDNASGPCHDGPTPPIICREEVVDDDLEVQNQTDFINNVETTPQPHGDVENDSVLDTNSGGASDGENDNDGMNTPQIYPIHHHSRPPITGDFQEGDQNENQAQVGETETSENETADIDRSQPVAEQLINMEAIQNALKNDVDEILSENVVSASVLKDNEGENAQNDTGTNTHDEITPGAQHIYPSHSSTADDSQEDDASDVVYDLFDRPASPLLAEAIPEAAPVDLDASCDYRANVKSAAVVSLFNKNYCVLSFMICFFVYRFMRAAESAYIIFTPSNSLLVLVVYIVFHSSSTQPLRATSITSELRDKDALIRRQDIVDDIISKLQDSSVMNASDDCDGSQNVVLLRGDGG